MKRNKAKKEGGPMLGKVTRGGQTTIPFELRDALEIEEGSWLQFELADGGGLMVTPVKVVPVNRRAKP